MPQSYTPEFKKKIVRLHEEEGRTYKSITAEYSVSKASISKWCCELHEECQASPQAKDEYTNMKEMLKLKCVRNQTECTVIILRSIFSFKEIAILSQQLSYIEPINLLPKSHEIKSFIKFGILLSRRPPSIPEQK